MKEKSSRSKVIKDDRSSGDSNESRSHSSVKNDDSRNFINDSINNNRTYNLQKKNVPQDSIGVVKQPIKKQYDNRYK